MSEKMRWNVLPCNAKSIVSKFILFAGMALAISFMLGHLITAQSTQTSVTDPPAVPSVVDAVPASSGSADEWFPPAVGTWGALTNQPPVSVTNCLLLTDGRVLCQQYGSRNWYALTPTNSGSYSAGTWSPIGSMQAGYAPLYYSSAVLPDGRVIVMGGEYECTTRCTEAWETNGSIYNPVTNTWTAMTAPAGWTTIGDAMALILANGTYVQTDCCSGKAATLNPSTLTWTALSGTQIDNYNNEEGWVLLPDGTVLNVDIWASNKNQTERYNPTTGLWTSAGITPVALVDNRPHSSGTYISREIGPGILRPNGTVLWIGAVPEPAATAHTGIYDTATNTWSAGPDIPNHDGGNDAPGAVLPNGNVLTQLAPAASVSDAFGTPSHFYEFDGTSFTAVGLPTNCGGTCNFPAYIGGMLVLPTGQVLLTEQSNHVEVYTPSGSASASWRPTITSAPGVVSASTTYTISGTQFNGLGTGASYGDDLQAATNYPLVRITNRATGHVFYAKTHDHSTMGVATGGATVSTQFDVPAGIENGPSDIEVVANGIPSAKTAITVGTTIAVTVKTNPAGLQITVDGTNYTAPQNFSWIPGSSHTIATTTPQISGATRDVFSNWSDSGAISHSVAPAVATTYTANFTTQYLLATNVFPAGGGTIAANPVSGDGYYNSGTSVQLTASATAGFTFSNWNGDLTGTTNPQSVVMSVPRTVNANFSGISTGLRFIPVTPCRVMDTRGPNGPLGGPSLVGGATRTVPLPSSSCGLPASAAAYSLNVTVVPKTGTLSYITLWPAGQAQPLVSTLNAPDGSILANAAIVPSGTAGAINVFATQDTESIIDVNGYFSSGGTLQFYPLTPCRVLDTRNPAGAFGGPAIAGGTSRSFPIPSSACGVPATATAYSFNATVVPSGSLGYLTAWPTGSAQPVVSTLNSLDGTILANAAIVPAGTGGAVSFFASDTTQLVVDINGYFAPPGAGGLNFYNVSPCRIADTRNANGPLGGPIMSGGTTRTFPVLSSACLLPAGAAAYSLNMTIVPSGPLGFLTTWPTGQAQPLVSTLNAPKGFFVANAAIVPAGTGGSVNLFVTDTTHVIIDVNGYFGP